jgi:putative transposase
MQERQKMKKSRFSETQILNILKSVEADRTIRDVCREHAISESSYFNWKAKYGGMQISDIKRLHGLEADIFAQGGQFYFDARGHYYSVGNSKLRMCCDLMGLLDISLRAKVTTISLHELCHLAPC